MLLITGGLGFIGVHTARALLDLGQKCVLTQHRANRIPDFLKDEIGSRVFVEQVDITDTDAFMGLGKKHEITGIVHLLTGGPSGGGPFEEIRAGMTGLANGLQAAYEWKVKRISVASALGVYNGITSVPWREDQLISCTALFSIEAFKKASEVFSSLISNTSGMGFECITMRIAGIYGPLYNPTRRSLAGRLVHAAVKQTEPNLENIRGYIYAEDGGDWCYAKDCGRAIALLMTASELRHQVYNVASGRPTRNQDLADAIRKVSPDFSVELPPGRNPDGPGVVAYQDITRLREDTGYEPRFDIDTGIADYIAWLRAGNAE